MTEIPSPTAIWIAKLGGAVAGSAMSLAYVLPHGRREAALRFFSGLAAGVVFGTTAGVAIADWLGIADVLSDVETVLMGAAVASLSIWWALGVGMRVAERKAGAIRRNGDPSTATQDGAANDRT